MRGLGQLAAFVQRVRERLLAVDVLAGADGRHRRDGVNVVGRADRDGVDVFGFLVDHLAEIFVAPRLGKCAERPGGALVVDVAQGDDVGSEPGHGGDVASAHAAGADSADIDSLARRDEARPAQHVARDDHEVEGEPAGRGQERATRTIAGFGWPSCHSLVMAVPFLAINGSTRGSSDSNRAGARFTKRVSCSSQRARGRPRPSRFPERPAC